MSNDEFERFLEGAAPEYNRPPEPPREEMWAEIRARRSERERRERSTDLPDRRARQQRMRRLRRWTPWGVGIGIAATLAVGFGLGRISGDITRVPSSPVATAPSGEAERGADAAPSRSVRLAAAGHLGEAEAMLTFYRAADRDTDRAATARWAQELLTTTRLLIDSRAGEDPALASLLEDLELVLVQITAAGSGASEQGLIEQGMEQNQLLPKLRTASGGPLDMAL